jgi:hypothetical protein
MIENFISKIKNNENFSFVKIGDGEIDCMIGRQGSNCDNHPYSRELGEKIKESFIDLSKKSVLFADWFASNPPINSRDIENLHFYNNLVESNNLKLNLIRPFEILLTGWDNLLNDDLLNFYTEIKKSNRKKIYVGPKEMNGINKMLNTNSFVQIPKINAFSEHQRILEEIKNNLVDDSIILLTVGLMSSYISSEILKINENITILDIGSGLDSVFIGSTRSGGQAMPSEAINYYKNILK